MEVDEVTEDAPPEPIDQTVELRKVLRKPEAAEIFDLIMPRQLGLSLTPSKRDFIEIVAKKMAEIHLPATLKGLCKFVCQLSIDSTR